MFHEAGETKEQRIKKAQAEEWSREEKEIARLAEEISMRGTEAVRSSVDDLVWYLRVHRAQESAGGEQRIWAEQELSKNEGSNQRRFNDIVRRYDMVNLSDKAVLELIRELDPEKARDLQ